MTQPASEGIAPDFDRVAHGSIRRHAAVRGAGRDARAISAWLFTLCAMVFVMVVLGGATRVTGSGLSIMEWAPLRGVLPPLTQKEWLRLYRLYQEIPQYALVNRGFGPDGFKRIFWLEWVHRNWGRLLGVVLLGPLVVFLVRRTLPPWILASVVGLFLLGGAQAGIGWFMVASGFAPDSTAVAPTRLALHLSLALLIYAGLVWTALSSLGTDGRRDAGGIRASSWVVIGLVAATIVAGAFVAGLHAGLVYNTFPLMGGRLVPRDYWVDALGIGNFLQNTAAVQFDHRVLASVTVLAALALAIRGLVDDRFVGRRRPFALLAGAVGLQYGLGILLIVLVVPVDLAILHQAVAVLVLTAAIAVAHALRRAPALAGAGLR